MLKPKVKQLEVDTTELETFIRIIQKGRGSFTNDGLFKGAQSLVRWYRERFNNSGGGTWAPLSKSYRKVKPYNKDKPLVLTRQLQNGISVVARSNQRSEFTVGYVGANASAVYDNSENSRYDFDGTVTQLARIHNNGIGVTQREIIVDIPPSQLARMSRSIERGIRKDVIKAASRSNRGR